MAAWRNRDLVVYHGTEDRILTSVLNGITLGACRPNTDFGQGFYTTTSIHQAEQWANSRVRRSRRAGSASNAVVIPYELDREILAASACLVFSRATADFWMFVSDCRSGVPPHQRTISATGSSAYDVVFGPVTLWPQRLTIVDCDQIAFHTQAACDRLVAGQPIAARYPGGLF